ncbi:MAG: S-layer homology domain-containing protein [Anaerovorax sp.]
MKKKMRKSLCMFLAFIMMFAGTQSAFAVEKTQLQSAITDTAAYMYATVKSPEIGSVGGEWAILGLARSGYEVPEDYYQNYYQTVETSVKDCKGILHDKKYTEYARIIIALTAIGKDARNVAGYDLTTPLGDYDKTIWQGINGPVWALIALDSGNYPMPVNPGAKVQASRDLYIKNILDSQLPDGGWSLTKTSDVDITGMVLQALAKYKDRSDVKIALEKALACMSKLQVSDGGFSYGTVKNSESCVQMIIALSELGISIEDARFVKNGKTILDKLLTFYVKGKGFQHTIDGSGENQMAAEQGLCGLVAAQRFADGKNSLYRMSDAIKLGNGAQNGETGGLAGKEGAVRVPSITIVGKTFEDVKTHKNQLAIESLASRQIINGKTDMAFQPDETMTRAEFATIVVKALGLMAEENSKFSDVKSGAWYAGYVGTANKTGIVKGKSEKTFDPQGTITREEAASMVARAAKLCGMETKYQVNAVRDTLAGFSDYVKCSSWAREPLAFCYDKRILDREKLEILPKEEIKRCEIAQMIYNMLHAAKLI